MRIIKIIQKTDITNKRKINVDNFHETTINYTQLINI